MLSLQTINPNVFIWVPDFPVDALIKECANYWKCPWLWEISTIDWEKLEGEREKYRIFFGFCWCQLYAAACYAVKQRGNILDLVEALEENMVENVSVGDHCSTSDHEIVTWELVMKEIQELKAYVTRPNFFKADYELVRKRT